MSQHKILEIKLDDIVPDKDQPRRSITDDGLINLKGSIEQMGLIYPLVVRATDDGKYMLIDGERRFRALKELEISEISCLVMDVKDSVEASFQQLIANIARDDLPTLDYCSFIFRLVNEHGQSQKEIARKINRSESNISNAMKIGRHLEEGDFPEKLKALIEDGSVRGLSTIYGSIQMYEEKGEEGFNEGVNQIIAEQKAAAAEEAEESEGDAAAEAEKPAAEDGEDADPAEKAAADGEGKTISRETIQKLRAKNEGKPKSLETRKVPIVAVGDYLNYQQSIVKIIDVDEESGGDTIMFICERDAPIT